MTPTGMETPMASSSSSSKKEVEFNSERYSILIYIELSAIVFQISSININPIKTFKNSFSLEKLIEINNFFTLCKNLDAALKKINAFLKLNDYSIKSNKQNNNIIYFCFPPNDFVEDPIEIPLKKYKKENDLSYDIYQ